MITQGLWLAHYQILSIIFLKELIILNVNTDTIIKNVKLVELHTKYATIFLKTNFKDDLIEYNCAVTKIINKHLMKS